MIRFMIHARNIAPVTVFDSDDLRIANKLGIVVPELWITDRYEARLEREGLSLQVNPDGIIDAYDRLEISEADGENFGVLLDSLHYDEGAETQREYRDSDFRYPRTIRSSELPYFTLRADATPTEKEHSAALADFGLLLGSKVMNDLMIRDRADELAEEQSEHAKNVKFGGVVAQLATGVGNIVATGFGVYQAVPYIGGGAGIGVVLAGVGARVITNMRSKQLEEEAIYEFAEDEEEPVVQKIADSVKIISFVPDIGGTIATRGIMENIRRELENL